MRATLTMLKETRAILFVAGVALAGCVSTPKPVSVAYLLENPGAAENRAVRLHGCYLFQPGGISALSDKCPVTLTNDYRPYAKIAVDLWPADENSQLAGRYIEVTGVFRRYGKRPDDVLFNLRGVSDVGQVDVDQIGAYQP